MRYKPAYMVVNNGQTKSFVGNYDDLADLQYDFSPKQFYCWEEKDALFVRFLTPDEFKARQVFIFYSRRKEVAS